jgi:hypothetical protein
VEVQNDPLFVVLSARLDEVQEQFGNASVEIEEDEVGGLVRQPPDEACE